MKTKDQLKPALYAAMEKAERARAIRKLAQANVPEWQAERAAVEELNALWVQYNLAPESEDLS
jgi:hypothetical protein